MGAENCMDMSKGGSKEQRRLWGRDGDRRKTVGESEGRAHGENLGWERQADLMKNGNVVGNSHFN